MALAETPRFINPYEIFRPHFSEEKRLRLGSERILLDTAAIVGFGNTDSGNGAILFVTTNMNYPVLTEYGMFTGQGIKEDESDEINTLDLYIRLPEKIFLGKGGEFEIQTKDRDDDTISLQILSTHPFIPEILKYIPDYNVYLRDLQALRKVRINTPLVLP